MKELLQILKLEIYFLELLEKLKTMFNLDKRDKLNIVIRDRFLVKAQSLRKINKILAVKRSTKTDFK